MVYSFPSISIVLLHLYVFGKSRCQDSPVSIAITGDESQPSASAGGWRRAVMSFPEQSEVSAHSPLIKFEQSLMEIYFLQFSDVSTIPCLGFA